MMKKICSYLTNKLNLSEEINEIMYYGMFVLVTNLASIISVLFIGDLLGEFKHTLMFIVSFIPLRLYIGGYHASTPIKCYVYFNVISSIFILLFKANINRVVLTFVTVLLLLVVFLQIYINKQSAVIKIVVCTNIFVAILLINYSYNAPLLLGMIMAIMLYEFEYITKKY